MSDGAPGWIYFWLEMSIEIEKHYKHEQVLLFQPLDKTVKYV